MAPGLAPLSRLAGDHTALGPVAAGCVFGFEHQTVLRKDDGRIPERAEAGDAGALGLIKRERFGKRH